MQQPDVSEVLECIKEKARADEELKKDVGPYNMKAEEGEYAGLCLIFNIITDKVECLPTRTGSDKDVQRITSVFGERFGYKVLELQEKTGEEMKQELQKTAASFKDKWRCFVCFVLSHGLGEEYIADAAGDEVNVRDLMDCLDGENCPRMNGKPKLFFFQMCRGFDREEYERSQHAYDIAPRSRSTKDKKMSPHRDRLICYATTPGRMAPMDPKEGSLFIQTLMQVLEEKGHETDIIKVLQEVTRLVDGKSFDEYKVCPTYEPTLVYDLMFPLRVNKKVEDIPDSATSDVTEQLQRSTIQE